MNVQDLKIWWLPSVLCLALTTQAAAQTNEAASLLKQKCFQCHSDTVQMANLNLQTREAMLKGGDKGPAIVPGNPEASRLYRRVSGLEKPAMPMAPMAPLTAHEIAILKSWIEQGAPWATTTTSQPVSSWLRQRLQGASDQRGGPQVVGLPAARPATDA